MQSNKPQMNTDEHKSVFGFLICENPCLSVADLLSLGLFSLC